MAGIFAGTAFVEILPEMKRFANEAQSEVRKAAGAVESEASSAFSNVGKAATLAITASVVAIGAVSLEMADKFEKQHARLETALHNVGTSFEEERTHVTALDKTMEKLGFTNADTEGSLSTLVSATHNSDKALTDMHLAADVARGRNIDLASATAILVKVETGHVALLGRLGVNVKDANGNLITQAEALKRLSAIYGGNASAYAQTFAGKMQVLTATSEDLAKNIGLRLIPVLEGLASGTLHVVTWFEEHRAVAVALGIVIGGPLVAAMATYVALQAKALAMNVVEFFGGIANAAAAAVGPLLGLDAAVAGMTAEGGIGAAAAGSEAFAGGLGSIAVGGAVALGVVAAGAGAFALWKHWTDDAQKSDDSWAGRVVANAAKQTNANAAIAAERAKLTAQIDAELKKNNGAYDQLAATAQSKLQTLNKEWKKHQEAISKASADAAKDHAAASAQIEGDATGAGAAATAEGKAMVKALADLQAAVGPTLAAIDAGKNYSVDQIKAIADQSKATASSMAGSFDSATSVVDKFGSEAQVAFGDVNKFMKEQVAAARDWSSNLIALTKAGVDDGLIRQLADAGPKAAPLVQALLNDVKAGNLQAINQAQADLRSILGDTITQVNAYDQDFYATGQAAGAQLAAGFAAGMANIATAGAAANKAIKGITAEQARGLVPGLAGGGFVDHPTLAMIGEKSRREVVLPLEDRKRSFELLEQSGLFDAPYAPPAGALSAAGPVPSDNHTHPIYLDGRLVTQSGNRTSRKQKIAHS